MFSLRLVLVFLLLAAFVVAPLMPLSVHAAAREPVRGKRGMVASQSKLASEIGVDVMRRGGNAVDAAVAVALAMAVTYPEAGNIGGGGFMLMRFKDGRATAIDYREKAPAAASRNVYINDKGELIRGEGSSTMGYRASGVPGTVAGLALALEKYGSGKFKWAQLIEPARKLAVNGFPLSHRILNVIRGAEKLAPYQDSKRIFLNNGKYFEEGDLLRQPELAATLGRMQKQGPREFYEGRTAQLIAEDMKRHNGLMTLDDLKKYQPTERAPLRGTYRGHEIISMPPPSSGGTALLQMLNILEGYDLASMSWSSVERYHVIAEAMRRAFADRSAYMGDADFVKVPVSGMIDKDYAASLRATISLNKASRSADVRAGNPPTGREGMDTTHFTIVDGDGNCVSNTYTLNDLYGSGVTAEGTGIVLNDEMDDFAARPGTPNAYGLIQGENNAVQGGKRPLSSMTPTIVLRRDGTLWFAVGARGGPRIISASLQAVINVIDHRMNIQQALDAPRIHHQWLPDEIMQEPFGLSLDTQRLLLERGHRFGERPQYVAQTTGIMIEENTGVRLGAVDSRGDGEAVGY